MLGFLFRGLTAEPALGAALFEALVAEARQVHWYLEGGVPDSLDGRFAVLATIMALTLVRLERDDERGDRMSVALTERFIEVMESEHRELGLGDPTLGKTVRKLVGMLARRTDQWRAACSGERDWSDTARESLYKGDIAAGVLEHGSAALKLFHERLGQSKLADLEEGKLA
jgi:cytochrome b pre-mRNA-processing protein 3